MRLFIAIPLPAQARAELMKIQKELLRVSDAARPVPRDNMHITLRFLGETRDLASAAQALSESVRGFRPFSLHLTRYGCFRQGGGKTAYMGVGGDLDELNSLFEALDAALFEHGFSREHRRFTPHITLARSVELSDEAEADMGAIVPNASFLVNAVELYESSRRSDGKMVYTRLHRASL